MYQYLKSLHLIFLITWFAGLFYIVRLFVYYAEASLKSEPERTILIRQYNLMQKRLWYIITWPSAILTSGFAFSMLFLTPLGRAWLDQPWMHVKLVFVALLYGYHFWCHRVVISIGKGKLTKSPNFYRLFNEIPTVILFSVVFLVVLKNEVDWIYGTLSIIGLSILLMIGFKWYKRFRESNLKK